MKPITVHPVSVLLGAALVGLSLLLIGAAQASFGTVRPVPTPEVRLVGEIPAEWWTQVELRTTPPAQTFTVPANHYFVATFLSGTSALAADGQVVQSAALTNGGNGTRVPFQSGTELTATGGGGPVFLWGYLEPVR